MTRQSFVRTTLVSACIMFAVGVSAATEVMNAEFRTLASCLQGIKKGSGQTLKIVTDTPSEVSGFLADGQGFACERTESGTKGTYFRGWYMVK